MLIGLEIEQVNIILEIHLSCIKRQAKCIQNSRIVLYFIICIGRENQVSFIESSCLVQSTILEDWQPQLLHSLDARYVTVTPTIYDDATNFALNMTLRVKQIFLLIVLFLHHLGIEYASSYKLKWPNLRNQHKSWRDKTTLPVLEESITGISHALTWKMSPQEFLALGQTSEESIPEDRKLSAKNQS